MKLPKISIAALSVLLASSPVALAQAGPNDFFGGTVPSAPPGVDAAASRLQAGGGDYTEDEKRMQKKYRSSLAHAKGLISKGDAMMRKGEKSRNDKLFKKGKILKDIGEKRLAELQANNPFPDLQSAGKDKKDANKAQDQL